MLKAIYQGWQDERLLKAYARGQHRAFTLLFERHDAHLVSFLFHRCSDQSVAEEIAQETWLTVARQCHRFDATHRFKTWLFTIARRKHIDHWRKQTRQQQSAGFPLANELERLMDANAVQGHEQVAAHQLLDRIQQLSESQKEALLLKLAGFSQNEIAQITNSKRETVKSRIRYATSTLRDAWPMPESQS